MSLPTQPSADDLTKLSKLKISTSTTKSKKAAPVAESWEDEEPSSGSDTGTADDAGTPKLTPSRTSDLPGVPPPTPASPTNPGTLLGAYGPRGEELSLDAYTSEQPIRQRKEMPDRRPDKTTSVAARLIAGGLGMKAPRRTEEQREYDKAMGEKEKTRREGERKARAEEEQAKKSIWED